MIDILTAGDDPKSPTVLPVEWSEEWKNEWRKEYKSSPAGFSKRLGVELRGLVSRVILLKKIPTRAERMIPTATYDSIDSLEGDLRPDTERAMPGAALSVAIGRDFLVPQDSRLDDYDLLRKAVDIAKDPEYREKRKAFNDWRRDFLNSEGEIDVSSLENAKDELETLVHQERELLERRKGWTVAKHILFVVQVAGMLAPSIAIASEAFGVSSQPLAFSSAQAFVAAGSFAVTNK